MSSGWGFYNSGRSFSSGDGPFVSLLVWGFRSEYAFKFLLCAAPKKEGFLSRRLERPADGPTDRPTDLDPTREAATNVMLRERS